jgi:PKD repeat protein
LSKTSRLCIAALAAATFAFAAPSALAAPTPSFTVAPANPQSGATVTFTSTSTAPIPFAVTGIDWDFDGNGTFETPGSPTAPATHTFQTAGSYTVNMRATSNELLDNQASATATVVVTTRSPTADFGFNPSSPSVNDPVLFASNSSDPDGEDLAHLWNFGDGTAQSTQRNPTHAYTTPGQKTVRLTVNDGHGGVDDLTRTITVRDPSAAKAAFTFTPQTPVADQTVTFTSTSTPSAGQSISSQTWDLDSDGQYDDGSGKTVTRKFANPGVYRVALRVVQANGNPAVAEGTVRVGSIAESPGTTLPTPTSPSPTTPGKPVKGRLSLLTPFPVVRLVGAAYTTRTIVTVLSVQSPRGALMKVRCKGTGCPKVVRRKKSKGRGVRFKTFERGIRAGAKLEIFVVAKNRIGKYTSFKMLRAKPPRRTDRCLVPGRRKPVSCTR